MNLEFLSRNEENKHECWWAANFPNGIEISLLIVGKKSCKSALKSRNRRGIERCLKKLDGKALFGDTCNKLLRYVKPYENGWVTISLLDSQDENNKEIPHRIILKGNKRMVYCRSAKGETYVVFYNGDWTYENQFFKVQYEAGKDETQVTKKDPNIQLNTEDMMKKVYKVHQIREEIFK